ncbi:MAG: UDP-N-acetylmuramate dehydrogenase [Myxococcales bacterium]|nr:UDP-N-acetylmuramate dehydrogenase [Myxococcales bacterium]
MSFVPGPAERVPEPRPEVDYSKVRSVHLMGIGGSAMGNFAGMLQSRGLEVRGSDAGIFDPMRGNLERWKIPFQEGYKAENLGWNPDLVVVGNVIRRDNPEATAMRAQNLAYTSFPEALGEWLLRDRTPVVVTGTHGKTTTTSLLAWLLEATGRSPGLLVGGVPTNLGRSFQIGSGDTFVIEGDEYDTAYYDKRPKFVHYRPHHTILTSVEFDHADIYPDFAAVSRAFRLLASLVDPNGQLCAWGGDPRVTDVLDACRARVLRYGLSDDPGELDAIATLSELGPTGAHFDLHVHGTHVGKFVSPMAGRHNVRNATAALLTVLDLGVPVAEAAEALSQFKGIKKRQEVRGVVNDITVIDDYAHHPTAVEETIAAIRAAYPGQKLWALFEAESNTSRRQIFEQRYPPAFAQADEVVFCSPLRKEGDKLREDQLLDVGAMVRVIADGGTPAHYLPDVADIVDLVATEAKPGDVILAMSGRNFRGLHADLLARLAADQ